MLRAPLIVPMTFAVWSTLYRIPYRSIPRRRRCWEEYMEVTYPRCAGLDVHKETVVACVRIVAGGEVSRLSADVRDDDGEPDRVGRVAGSERLHACGDGSDRGVLEAGVAGTGGWCLRTHFGKRGTGEERAWSQDRRK